MDKNGASLGRFSLTLPKNCSAVGGAALDVRGNFYTSCSYADYETDVQMYDSTHALIAEVDPPYMPLKIAAGEVYTEYIASEDGLVSAYVFYAKKAGPLDPPRRRPRREARTLF